MRRAAGIAISVVTDRDYTTGRPMLEPFSLILHHLGSAAKQSNRVPLPHRAHRGRRGLLLRLFRLMSLRRFPRGSGKPGQAPERGPSVPAFAGTAAKKREVPDPIHRNLLWHHEPRRADCDLGATSVAAAGLFARHIPTGNESVARSRSRRSDDPPDLTTAGKRGSLIFQRGSEQHARHGGKPG